MAKKIVQKKLNDYEILSQKTKKIPGYMGKMTSFLFNGVEIEDICTLIDDLESLARKDCSIDIYDEKYTYEKICDEVISQNNKIHVRKIRQELPKVLKDSYKELTDYGKSEMFTLFLQLHKKPDKATFIKKISRYQNIKDVKAAIKIFLKEGIVERPKIEELVGRLDNSYIVSSGDNYMVVQVDSQENLKELASDTAWCIVNSRSNWNNYTKGGNTQYILYDFTHDVYNPMSKVGFTLKSDGSWRAGHDKLDGYIGEDHFHKIATRFGFNVRNLKLLVEVPILPLGSLRKTTSYQRYKEFGKFCKLEEVLDFCKKVLKFNRYDKSEVYIAIGYALRRLYTDGISVEELNLALNSRFNIAGELVKYASDTIYSNQGHHLEHLSLEFIEKKASKMNFNHMDKYWLHEYTLGSPKISMDILTFIYNYLKDNKDNLVFTEKYDLNYYKTMCFFLGLHLEVKYTEEEFSEYYNILTYEDKIKFIRLFPENTVALEPDKDNSISIPPHQSRVKKQNYKNIILEKFGFKRTVDFLEYNKDFQMHVRVDSQVSDYREWHNVERGLLNTLVKILEEPTKVVIYKDVVYSYYKKPKT